MTPTETEHLPAIVTHLPVLAGRGTASGPASGPASETDRLTPGTQASRQSSRRSLNNPAQPRHVWAVPRRCRDPTSTPEDAPP